MPKITIYESDNTGSTYNGDEINVFVPGNCTALAKQAIQSITVDKVVDGSKISLVLHEPEFADPVYVESINVAEDKVLTVTLKATKVENVSITVAEDTSSKDSKKVKAADSEDTVKYLEGQFTGDATITLGGITYTYSCTYDTVKKNLAVKKYVVNHAFDEHNCMLIPVGANIKDYLVELKENADNSYKYVKDLLSAGLGVVYFKGTPDATNKNLEFLYDYNAYNVEILTMGAPKDVPSKFEKGVADYLIDICGSRKDCFALIDYPTKTADTMQTVCTALNDLSSSWCQYAAAFVDWNTNTGMPGSYTYLMKLADANVGGKRWDSVSGVQRGVVNSIYSGSIIKMDKYTLDNVIQTKVGRSYNGIVKVRPYGWTIWGDRTLLANDEGTGLKATSFLSIRLMICDIVKRAYNAAINNTFESNNDITWTNYKLEIQTLLDRMVASGKLASYKLVRKATTDRAKIACIIRLVPNEPVEDFDIYIDLQNGSAEVTEG